MKGFGVPLTAENMADDRSFSWTVHRTGLELKFERRGPSAERLLPDVRRAPARNGRQRRQRNYLALEADFQFVKSLQAHDRIVPVVGNLSGPSALAGIGRVMVKRARPCRRSTRRTSSSISNDRAVINDSSANLGRLPHTNRSVIIRSVFNRGIRGSTSIVQPVEELSNT